MFDLDEEPENEYDQAQVCLNGHLINDKLLRHPSANREYCGSCGAKAIKSCPACGKPIVGQHFRVSGGYDAPSFCEHCGAAYPWKGAKILAAKAMADEVEGLNDADKILLKTSIDDIAADTPMTEVAVLRFKKLIPKMAQESAGAMRRLVVDIAGKAAAELLKGGGQ
jgi:hypothetical protein